MPYMPADPAEDDLRAMGFSDDSRIQWAMECQPTDSLVSWVKALVGLERLERAVDPRLLAELSKAGYTDTEQVLRTMASSGLDPNQLEFGQCLEALRSDTIDPALLDQLAQAGFGETERVIGVLSNLNPGKLGLVVCVKALRSAEGLGEMGAGCNLAPLHDRTRRLEVGLNTLNAENQALARELRDVEKALVLQKGVAAELGHRKDVAERRIKETLKNMEILKEDIQDCEIDLADGGDARIWGGDLEEFDQQDECL